MVEEISCGLVSGQDWLHYAGAFRRLHPVADWSQARIGYTSGPQRYRSAAVADWSQARIGYTLVTGRFRIHGVADWSQARIGYTPFSSHSTPLWLRIGLRPGLVTPRGPKPRVESGCGLVSGQDWLHSRRSLHLHLAGCGLVSGQDWLHSPPPKPRPENNLQTKKP